ncbi:MAG: transglutaminaseTgpA domain-containing protein [Myxococcota bacterium]
MRRSHVLEACTIGGILGGLLAMAALGGWLMLGSGITAIVILIAPFGRRFAPARTPWAVVTGVCTIGALIVPLIVGGTVIDAVAAACLVLLALRRWARRGPTDDRTSAVITLLMLVIAASLDPQLLVGLGVLLWILTTPVIGVLAFLESTVGRRSRERSVVGSHLLWVSIASGVVALLVFVALPRFRTSHLGTGKDAQEARIGFADQVHIGAIDRLLDDPTPVLRLSLPQERPAPIYIRGLVLDAFDGQSWKATIPNSEPPPGPPPLAIPIEVIQEAAAGPVAFAPGQVMWTDGPFTPDEAGSWRLAGPPRRLAYTAWTLPLVTDHSPPDRWTLLPDLDPRISALSAEIIGLETGALPAAAAVSEWLVENATYTRLPRDASTEAPLTTFLFTTRAGHCEYFATAAAVLLRAQNYPARVVNGYANPDYNAAGNYYLARQGHAHAWIEVRDADGIWHTVDPTPGGSRPPTVPSWQSYVDVFEQQWSSRVLTYDGSTQANTVWRASGWLQRRVTGSTPTDTMPWVGLVVLIAAALSIAILIAGGLRGAARRLAGETQSWPEGPVARVHHRGRQLIERQGWQVPASLPPVEAAEWLTERSPDAGRTLKRLAWLHYRVRYAEEPDAAHISEAKQLLAALRSEVVRPPADAGLDG